MSDNSTRRQFLRQSSVAAAGALLIACSQAPQSRWRFFTEDEARLLDAITEQIIPTDEHPGAIEAGCLNFIDKQLVGEYARHQGAYRDGLASLSNMCRAEFGLTFSQLDWDTQTALLERLEAGTVDEAIWPNIQPSAFFNMIVDHAMQGFYGSPRHGGNKNYISYQMLELDYPHINGQNRYRQGMDTPVGYNYMQQNLQVSTGEQEEL